MLCAAMMSAALPVFCQDDSGQYAVILKDPPVAQRFVAREAMRAAEGESYRRQIVAAQESLRQEMAARNIPVVASVDTLLNAVFVAATPDRVAEMKRMAGVL